MAVKWEHIEDWFYFDPNKGYAYECPECSHQINVWDEKDLPEECPYCKGIEEKEPEKFTGFWDDFVITW